MMLNLMGLSKSVGYQKLVINMFKYAFTLVAYACFMEFIDVTDHRCTF